MNEFSEEDFKGKKVILHCDLNAFFASVEIKHRPELKGKPVAVCGAIEDRHGIVLAKTQEAKRFGVSTGEAIWQAQQKCPDLIIAAPHYELYEEYSAAAREIYYRYTDMVESFGMDECWLDVTGSALLFGNGKMIADELRDVMKKELGLSISVGVSYNKIFAKLGSDLKKPDATTIISPKNFKDMVWHLKADEMMGIGRATTKRLSRYGIYTLGQLARTEQSFCIKVLGKVGAELWLNVNGMGSDRVARYNDYAPMKSVGRGSTFPHDLTTQREVQIRLYYLAENVACRLRDSDMLAKKVQITVKNEDLICRDIQAPLPFPSQSWSEIAKTAFEIFRTGYSWRKNVRALTVRAIDLVPLNTPYQLNCFSDQSLRERTLTRELTVDSIRQRYGNNAIETAALFQYRATSPDSSHFDSLPKPQLS